MEDVVDIKKEFYNKLQDDKIKINWNKKPIKMDVFLSFLTVPVVRSNDHLGSDNGWTLLENEEIGLRVGGGVVGGVEYLDHLELGIKLSNPYNNYVNPFYLWEILNSQGRKFFFGYYADEISNTINDVAKTIEITENKLAQLKASHKKMVEEESNLKSNSLTTVFTTNFKK
jgi:hypothetical protein